MSNKKEIEYWLKAEQGDAYAQIYLGFMYANGYGVPQDDQAAVKWYRLAAEQGDAFAQYNLGVMYDNGQGVLQAETEGESQ
jgi:TPR repeat protein